MDLWMLTQQTIKLYRMIINIFFRIVRVNVHCTEMLCYITPFCEVSKRNVSNSPPTDLVSSVVPGWGCVVARQGCRLSCLGCRHASCSQPVPDTTDTRPGRPELSRLSPVPPSPAPPATCAAQGWLAPNIRIRGEGPFTIQLNMELLTDQREAGRKRMLSNLVKSGEATPVEICIQLAQPKSGRSQTDVSERVPGAGPETEPGIISIKKSSWCPSSIQSGLVIAGCFKSIAASTIHWPD